MEETAQIIKKDCYIALDLETTGLDPRFDKIIEIGAVRVENGEVAGRFEMFVNPGRKLEARVMELTGITDAMLKDAPEIGGVMEAIADFTEGVPILGHNILFDYRFLKQAAVNLGMVFERRGIDTLRLCRRFMPGPEKKNLAAACRYYGVEPEASHRALADAVSAHLLYQAMKKRCFQEDPEAFLDEALQYRVKREQPATKKQKEVLRELAKYHKISLTVQIEELSRNEAARITDKIIAQYGKMIKR